MTELDELQMQIEDKKGQQLEDKERAEKHAGGKWFTEDEYCCVVAVGLLILRITWAGGESTRIIIYTCTIV